jgi:type I restriction enzyme, S subunit
LITNRLASSWERKPLRHLLIAEGDGAWGPEALPAKGIPVIRSTNMRGGSLSLESVARLQIPSKTVARKKLMNGDILISKSSGSSHLVGASVLFIDPQDGRDYLCSNFIRYMRPNPELIDPEYLYFFLQSPSFRAAAIAAQRTTSGLRNLNFAKYSAVSVVHPSLREQHRIVNRIKEYFTRLAEIKTLTEEAHREAAVIFSSALSTFINNRFPLKKLGSIVLEMRNGWFGKETTGGVRADLLRLSSVHGGTIDPAESKQVRVRKTERKAFRVMGGDLFIVRGNGSKHLVGRSAIATKTYDDVIFSDLLIRIRFASDVVPKFVHFALHSSFLRRQIEERAKTAAGIWKINQTHLSQLEIPCPDLSQQIKIIEKAEQTADLCRRLVAELSSTETDTISQSVLRKAFAGEL